MLLHFYFSAMLIIILGRDLLVNDVSIYILKPHFKKGRTITTSSVDKNLILNLKITNI